MSDVAYIGPGGRGGRRRPLLRTLVGNVLRRNRLEQRRTLADVAHDARVSMPYLSEIERGRKEASSEVLSAVCAALRMELSDLLAEVRHDLVKERAQAKSGAARAATRTATQNAAPAEPAAAAGERGQQEDRAPVVSLDAARRRRPAAASLSGVVPGGPSRFGDVVLLAA